MLKNLRQILSKRTGQNILEYSVLIALVAAAFTAMSFYVSRAVQGKLNDLDERTIPRKNVSTSYFVVPV